MNQVAAGGKLLSISLSIGEEAGVPGQVGDANLSTGCVVCVEGGLLVGGQATRASARGGLGSGCGGGGGNGDGGGGLLSHEGGSLDLLGAGDGNDGSRGGGGGSVGRDGDGDSLGRALALGGPSPGCGVGSQHGESENGGTHFECDFAGTCVVLSCF